MFYELAKQNTGIISLVNTLFWVLIGVLTMVEPAIKLAIVETMAKEPLLGRPSDEDMIRRPLLELHDALLHLHKVLLESERAVYEKSVGPIQSPNHFFQLLTGDPWFAWLRPISQLIVVIDESLDEKEALTNAGVDAVMGQSVFLLIPAESGGEFGQRYVAALQRDPRVVLAHAQVAKRIGSGKARA